MQRIPSYCPLCAGRMFTIDPIAFEDGDKLGYVNYKDFVDHYHMQCHDCEEDVCVYLFGPARKMSEVVPAALDYSARVTRLLERREETNFVEKASEE